MTSKKLKILNLYAGIGGNRKLWSNNFEITAVEYDKVIADIYQSLYPNDVVIIDDAHQYLLHNFYKYDFIWSSPPCPSHSKLRKNFSVKNNRAKPIYPDMKLYEEILFLQGYFNGGFCIENVESWYKPLITPIKLQRHFFWTNFNVPEKFFIKDGITLSRKINTGITTEYTVSLLENKHGIKLPNTIGFKKKQTMLRNCVNPEIGLHIIESFINKKED